MILDLSAHVCKYSYRFSAEVVHFGCEVKGRSAVLVWANTELKQCMALGENPVRLATCVCVMQLVMFLKLDFACPLKVAIFVAFLNISFLDYVNNNGDIELIIPVLLKKKRDGDIAIASVRQSVRPSRYLLLNHSTKSN